MLASVPYKVWMQSFFKINLFLKKFSKYFYSYYVIFLNISTEYHQGEFVLAKALKD